MDEHLVHRAQLADGIVLDFSVFKKEKNPTSSSPARSDFLLFSSVDFISAEVCIKLCVFNNFCCCLLPGKCLAWFGSHK